MWLRKHQAGSLTCPDSFSGLHNSKVLEGFVWCEILARFKFSFSQWNKLAASLQLHFLTHCRHAVCMQCALVCASILPIKNYSINFDFSQEGNSDFKKNSFWSVHQTRNILYLKVSFIILIPGLPNQSSIRLTGSGDGSRVLWVQPRKHLTDKSKHSLPTLQIR